MRRIATRLYSLGMTHLIGAKGQVVIPRGLREQLALGPGDEVDFEPRDGGVLIRRREPADVALGGRLAGGRMAARLLEDREAERR